ncbi:hypothetical protein ACQKOF_02570 [Lysinibacillus sp. NPDC093190]|uniref:hypothetical protein n=1 Tax=Lysinibacillus sp. NPDC093190 TaxID=3390575 RepID=UPI003D014C1F
MKYNYNLSVKNKVELIKTTDYPTLNVIFEDMFSHLIYYHNKIFPLGKSRDSEYMFLFYHIAHI